MNKKFISLSLILIIAIFFIGRYSTSISNEYIGYIPPLQIVGDIEEAFTLWELKKDFNIVTIEKDKRKIESINLEDIVLKSKPLSKGNDILLVGIDGLTSKIKAENLEDSYIGLSQENGWEAINQNHPISSNVKHLKEIVIISTDDRWDIGMNIIRSGENIENISVGELYANTSTSMPYFEGESKKEKDGKEYSTSVYTQKKILTVKDILNDYSWNEALIMSDKGDTKYIEESGYFEIAANHINYASQDGKEKIENVKGIILDPPKVSITDSYDDMVHYLEKEDVLFFFVDGLGYHQYEYALENNDILFLSSLEKAEQALSVYQPVTNAGFAAMITGKTPAENGVYSHDQREFTGDSIFKHIQNEGKEAVLIEGNIGILKTEIQPELNTDRNKDGSMDDEIFDSALKAIEDDNNLVFVHFKEIDYTGHSYGDLSKETIKVISKTDEYIAELVSKWKGKVIITADHGMHSTNDGGDHGEFRYEDIIVPYIVLEGGLSNE